MDSSQLPLISFCNWNLTTCDNIKPPKALFTQKFNTQLACQQPCVNYLVVFYCLKKFFSRLFHHFPQRNFILVFACNSICNALQNWERGVFLTLAVQHFSRCLLKCIFIYIDKYSSVTFSSWQSDDDTVRPNVAENLVLVSKIIAIGWRGLCHSIYKIPENKEDHSYNVSPQGFVR